MRKTIMVFGVLVLVLAISGGAFAAKGLLTGADIKNGSLTGADFKARSLGVGLFSAATLNKITGKQGAAVGGPPGPTGANGQKGDIGAAGVSGSNGAAGAQGLQGTPGASVVGPKGDKGDQGAPWVPSYGIADVKVSRGNGSATTWAKYSTTLGSPVGDTASGSFRFTCSTANAPCKVSLDAYTSGTKSAALYPRMIIYRQDYASGGPSSMCEYGDGTNNNGGTQALTTTPTATTLGIGGSLDCNSTQTYPAAGTASEIWVPEGYYDVWTTLDFISS